MEIPKPIQIDIDQIFKDKNPRVYRFLPKFILNWVKRTIHQNEINEVLAGSTTIKDVDFANYSLDSLKVTRSSTGLENIPKTGGVIVAANHPLGGLDGMALIAECAKIRPDVRFIVNDILLKLPNFETVFVGVNKVGNKQREQLQKIEELYAKGYCVLIFPAGLCSRKIKGTITDLIWQKSFIVRAKKYHLPIVPCFIEGQNSNRFYRLANWRKKLGIKANLEMFFLPDEMFKQKGKQIKMHFAKPVAPETWSSVKTADQWAQELKNFVYSLNSSSDRVFQQS